MNSWLRNVLVGVLAWASAVGIGFGLALAEQWPL